MYRIVLNGHITDFDKLLDPLRDLCEDISQFECLFRARLYRPLRLFRLSLAVLDCDQDIGRPD